VREDVGCQPASCRFDRAWRKVCSFTDPADKPCRSLESAGIPVEFRAAFRTADNPRNAFRGFRGVAG
jgi:hypothetical protein